jgi:hypothetical protein
MPRLAFPLALRLPTPHLAASPSRPFHTSPCAQKKFKPQKPFLLPGQTLGQQRQERKRLEKKMLAIKRGRAPPLGAPSTGVRPDADWRSGSRSASWQEESRGSEREDRARYGSGSGSKPQFRSEDRSRSDSPTSFGLKAGSRGRDYGEDRASTADPYDEDERPFGLKRPLSLSRDTKPLEDKYLVAQLERGEEKGRRPEMKQTYGTRPITDRPRQSNRIDVEVEVNGASESRLVFWSPWVSWFKTV